MNKHTMDGATIGRGGSQSGGRSGSGRRPERTARRVLGQPRAIEGVPLSGDALAGVGSPDGRRGSLLQTPITNRGSVTPIAGGDPEGGYAGIHQLNLTIWAEIPEVLELMDGVLAGGHRVGPSDWTFQPIGGRLRGRHLTTIEGVQVDEYVGVGFCQIVIRGGGCEQLGDAGIERLLDAVVASGRRWQATKLDAAFDGFPIDPYRFLRLTKAGHVRTRGRFDPDFMGDPEAVGERTAYTHKKPEKRGLERYARVYDQRGFNRFEQCWRKSYAKIVTERLSLLNRADWPAFLGGCVREFFDLLAAPSDRPDRADLLPEWAGFFAGVDRQRVPRGVAPEVSDDPEREIIAEYERVLQRAAGPLCELMEAYGPEYVRERLQHHVGEKIDWGRVKELRRKRGFYSSNRIAGVPAFPESTTLGDEVPI